MKIGKEMQNTSNAVGGLAWHKHFSLPPQSFPWTAPPHAGLLHSEYICNNLLWKNYVFSILLGKSSKSHTCTSKENIYANISPC